MQMAGVAPTEADTVGNGGTESVALEIIEFRNQMAQFRAKSDMAGDMAGND